MGGHRRGTISAVPAAGMTVTCCGEGESTRRPGSEHTPASSPCRHVATYGNLYKGLERGSILLPLKLLCVQMAGVITPLRIHPSARRDCAYRQVDDI